MPAKDNGQANVPCDKVPGLNFVECEDKPTKRYVNLWSSLEILFVVQVLENREA